jgi:hypothetical protein
MFRRIEMIHPAKGKWFTADWKEGLMSAGSLEIADAWIFKLRGSPHSLPSNARFHFTEKGWREIGRQVIAACPENGPAIQNNRHQGNGRAGLLARPA